jgi:hypothetical protein
MGKEDKKRKNNDKEEEYSKEGVYYDGLALVK